MHWQDQQSDLIQSLDKPSLKALNNHRATQLYLNTYVFRQNIDIKYLVQFYFIFFCAKHKKPVNMRFSNRESKIKPGYSCEGFITPHVPYFYPLSVCTFQDFVQIKIFKYDKSCYMNSTALH